jgi:hypothetical protein
MTKRIDRNQTFDADGNLISEEVVEVIEYPSPDESLIAAARLVVLPLIAADELKDEAAEQFAGLFPDWEPDIAVKVGEVYRWDGTLVEVVQAHTTQADWEPDQVPSLFKIHRTPTAAPWVQPLGAQDAYQTGEQVTHDAVAFPEFTLWQSKIDANTTEPGTDGTFHRWWEPLG